MAAIQRKIKFLINEGQYECINPGGELSENFILSCIVQHNEKAAMEQRKIITAYRKLKKQDAFIKSIPTWKVKEETLTRLVLYNETLIRPLNVKEIFGNNGVYFGEVIKLPRTQGQEYDESEKWKALIEKEKEINVGDKVIYSYRSNIILDNELLHLASFFVGKIVSETSTIKTK